MATVKKQIKTKFYAVLRPVGEADKVPPQAKLIVKTLEDAGGKLSREELLKLLGRKPEEGGLTTNQTPERILGFYKPKLAEIGILEEEVKVEEIEVEVADKPAKAAKPAKTAAPADDAAKDVVEGAAPVAHQTEKSKKGSKAAA